MGARPANGIVDGTPSALVPTTDRVLTVPNVLSALRLAAVPLFLYLVLGPEADGAAVLVLMASGVTDLVDGKIARRYGLISRVGQLLDPLADRLFVITTLAAFLLRDVVPWWLVAVLLGRDLVLAACLPILARHGWGPPSVSFLGKAATANLLYAFPLLLLAAGDDVLANVVRPLGWAYALWGTALYVYTGGMYLRQVRELTRAGSGRLRGATT